MTDAPSRLDVCVPPRFCDAQGMAHAIRYHEWIEDAFIHWLRHRRLPYDELRRSGVDLVIGTSTMRYRSPARLGDQLSIMATTTGHTRSTITVQFLISRGDDLLAEADVTYICVSDGRATAVPPQLH